MRLLPCAIAVLLLWGASALSAAQACGFGEAPGDCGQTAEGDARYMLLRAVNALRANERQALDEFQHGTAGFRTQDSYVFCIGPDGVMSAHPSPLLQGHDVRDLHDQTGNYFIATMLKMAVPSKVLDIRYLFPRPGSEIAVPKTTYYTRAGDQVCGVGVYDGDETPAATAPVSRQDRLAALRVRLNAAMPEQLKADWADYTRLSDEQAGAQDGAIAKAREQMQAAEITLTASR